MIGIAIVTFNNQATIEKCLKTIFENCSLDKKEFQGLEVAIVDNASQDKTLEKIRLFIAQEKISQSQINLLKNDQNLGFAKGANLAISHLLKNKKIEAVFLFNPDAFLKKNCLERLYKNLKKDSQVGAVSPLILEENGKIWFAKGRISWLRFKAFHEQIPFKKKSLDLPTPWKRKNFYLSGCAVLIKRRVFEEIGLFDEYFFLYYEDADFFLRAQKAGWQIKVIKNAICYHQESHSFNSFNKKRSANFDKKTYHLVKSGLYFFKKHTPLVFQPYFWAVFWLKFFYHFLYSQKKEVLTALLDFKNNTKAS